MAVTASANGAPTVRNLSATGRQPGNELAIRWDPPEEVGGPYSYSYRIYWDEAATDTMTARATVTGTGYVAEGLKPDTEYRVRVEATNTTNGVTGVPVTANARTLGSGTTTPPPSVTTPAQPPPPSCRPITAASRTTARIARVDSRRISALGYLSYWNGRAWQKPPAGSYLLTLQRLAAGTWVYVTRIHPDTTTYVLAGPGTYRLAYPRSCSTNMAASFSANIVVPPPAIKPKTYRNCTALNIDYPHGVAVRAGVKDKVSGRTKPVTNYAVSKTVYDLNKRALDRDHDLIACEKL